MLPEPPALVCHSKQGSHTCLDAYIVQHCQPHACIHKPEGLATRSHLSCMHCTADLLFFILLRHMLHLLRMLWLRCLWLLLLLPAGCVILVLLPLLELLPMVLPLLENEPGSREDTAYI